MRLVRLPFVEPHSRFTTLFYLLAIVVLSACSVVAAAGLLRSSWGEAWHPVDRAVTRSPAAEPLSVLTLVGVERAAGTGQDYVSVVSD